MKRPIYEAAAGCVGIVNGMVVDNLAERNHGVSLCFTAGRRGKMVGEEGPAFGAWDSPDYGVGWLGWRSGAGRWESLVVGESGAEVREGTVAV